MTRLLITEEALRNREGHWFEYNRATKAAVQSTGDIQVDMLGHQTMEPDVAEELGAIPHFHYTVWDQIYNHPQAVRRYFGIGQHNYRLYRDLSAYLKQAEFYDTVFAPTVVLHHLAGYHAIAKKFAGKRFGQLVLLIRNNIAHYDSEGNRTFRSTSRFWKWAIRRFESQLRDGTVRFVTDSERLADEYEELTGIRFEVLPHPSLVSEGMSEAKGVHEQTDREIVRVFLPGPSRYEKGTDRLLDAIRLVEGKLTSPIEFTLQWAQAFARPDGTMIGPDDAVSSDPHIKFRILREPLSSQQYTDELRRADYIILPYRRETYYARISGVAVEAMLLAKPIIYTRNTWVGTIAEQFGVGIAVDDDVESVARGIQGLSTHDDQYSQTAREQSSRVAEYFSAESFARKLIGSSR